MPTINIDELTLGQIKQIAAMAPLAPPSQDARGIQFGLGEQVIIRTYSAGVWFGTLAQKAGKEVVLHNARRMWSWKAAQGISLSAIAVHGIAQEESRISGPVDAVWMEAIEIIPCTGDAAKSIFEAAHAEAR